MENIITGPEPTVFVPDQMIGKIIFDNLRAKDQNQTALVSF